MLNVQDRLNDLAKLIETNPVAASEQIDQLSSQLKMLADALRNQAPRSPAGISDRIQMQVFGPDGKVKQSIDTGAYL